MSDKIKNLITRALSGAIFVVIMIASIYCNGDFFSIVFFLLTLIGLYEFYKLTNDHLEGCEVFTIPSVIGGAIVYLATYLIFFKNQSAFWLATPFIAFALLMIVELFREKQNPIVNIAVSLMGILYVAVPFSLLSYVESTEYGSQMLIAFFITIWASDTGAYLVGMLLGKHKMFERISPKKTWEGLAGGLIFSAVAGVIFFNLDYFPAFTLISWLTITILIFAFGVVGDLVESLIKRSLNVKDSGKFLPGHGGLLDRFDSALIAAPVLFFVALFSLIC